MRNNPRSSDADGRPGGDAVDSPLATHWTRILYCDLYTDCISDSTTDLRGRPAEDLPRPAADFMTTRGYEKDKEVSVQTTDSSRDGGQDRRRSSIQAAAILLTICILAYLALAGILHVMSVEAAAASPDSSLTPMSAAATSNPPVGVAQASPSNAFDQDSEPADSTRECGRRASNDLYD